MQLVDQIPHVVTHVSSMEPLSAAKARVKNVFEVLEDLQDDFVLGERTMSQMIDSVVGRVSPDNRIGQTRQLFFQSKIGRHDGNR